MHLRLQQMKRAGLLSCFLLVREPLSVYGFVGVKPPVVSLSPRRFLSAGTDDSTPDGIAADEWGASSVGLVSNATTFPISPAVVEADLLAPPDILTLWSRRLITREDPFSIHKLGSFVYTASGVLILGTGALRFLAGPKVFAEIPSSLELPSQVFCVSNIVMCLASVRMAFLHRKFDLTARNAFLGTAVSSLFSGFYFLWTSPFAPDVFNNQAINQSCFGVLVLLNAVFIMDTLLKIPEVVESRRDRKADEQGRFLVDALGYVLPIAWGLPVVASTGYIASVLHDRPWFLEQCLYIDQMTGQPGLNANVSYLQVMASFAASYGSLFVTLRDKKLITKQQELAGITAFSVPAMIWTIYVTVVFCAYLFDTH